MEADIFDSHKAEEAVDFEFFQGEKRKIIQPASLKDPKLEKLKETLVEWINTTLKPEHIVVQSLEEDLYDGLVLHHLLSRLAGVHLTIEEIALTRKAQIRKLEMILEELNMRLSSREGCQIKWNVTLIHNKDLLATLHLLVAMVRSFQPELDLPPNVKVEFVDVEVSRSGIKSDVQMEVLTEGSKADSQSSTEREDPIEQLLKLEPYKVNTVKKLHNVTLALDLLNELDLQLTSVAPQDIVSRDITATLKVLYALFKKHKMK
ncbi:gamma-parvin isoform 3-T4 [Pholidichthys leucotaenia]